MLKLRAYLNILRPSNLGLFFLAVWLGAWLVAGWQAMLSLNGILAALSGTLIGGAGNVINDVYDIDIDRINKPHRPLVSGKLTVKEAVGFWLTLSAAGTGIGFWISALNGGIALGSTLLLYAYSRWFKRRAFTGNVMVSSVASLGLVYGALPAGELSGMWFPVAFSFLFNLGREILKDLEDTEGDRAGGAETIPILIGDKNTLALVSAIYASMMALSAVPFWTGVYGQWYLASVMLTTNAIVLYVLVRAWQLHTKDNLYKLNTLLKVAMLTGIFSIALAKV